MYSTQLSDYKNYDMENLQLEMTDKKTENEPQRIRLITHHLDGTRGDLIFSTPRLLTFGLQELFDRDTHTLIGYQIPLVMWGKNGPTEDEKKFIDIIEKITDVSRDFLLEHREELNKPELERGDLTRLNPLYYKIDKGEVKRDHAPLLYARLNTFRNEDAVNIRTLFTDESTKETINPLMLLNKRCLIRGAIRLESIVVGANSRPRFQMKLFEACVKFLDPGFKSLLEPGKVFPRTKIQKQQQQQKPAPVESSVV